MIIKNRRFWFLAIPYLICGVTTTGLMDTHLISLAQWSEQHHFASKISLEVTDTAKAYSKTVSKGRSYLGLRIIGWKKSIINNRLLPFFIIQYQ